MLIVNLCLWSTIAWAHPETGFFNGRFELRDALTFHVVHDGDEDFTVHIRWMDGQQSVMDRPLMVRVFDPDERLMDRRFDPGKKVEGAAQWNETQLQIAAKSAGVYQIWVNGFAGAEVEFRVDPPRKWGVAAAPTMVVPAAQDVRGHFAAPTNSKSLSVRSAGALERFSIADRAGAVRMTLQQPQAVGSMALAEGADCQHSFQLQTTGRCELEFGSQSPIFCPDDATALAIGDGTSTSTTGMICHHKFQVRAHELLKRYRSLPPESFAVQVPNLRDFAQAWLAEPERNKLLLGPYGVFAALDVVLREQNLDPASSSFGQIYTWREGVRDSDRSLPAVAVLAAVYSIDAPFNPLHKSEALRNRIIIATLQDLMLLQEHELPDPAVSLYAGGERAFTFTRMTRAFPLVVRDCPPEVREVWIEAMQRYADRMTITQVANTVNQWSYIIRGLQQVADGVDDPHYAAVVRMHIDWLLTRNQYGHGHRPAGYFEESDGPDATYSGIALHNLVWIWERTRHEGLRRALHDCFSLFNHTIASEPNGMLVGTSSFSHRTGGTWLNIQGGGGVAMFADDSTAAGALLGKVWLAHPRSRTPGERRTREQELLQSLKYLPPNAIRDPNIGPATIIGGPEMAFALWEHYATDQLNEPLPVAAEDRFTRNFGDEFFCVRRPGYYAFLYAGSPMDEWHAANRPADARRQHPRNGGGLCMFWSPRFGSSINARNWSAFAAHCLIAQHESGADWEDYWSIDRRFDVSNAAAMITGKILNQPLTFRRAYSFHDDRIDCELAISASQALRLSAFTESFPFPIDKPVRWQIVLLDAGGKPIKDGPTSAIAYRSPSIDEAHLIVFDEPRVCRVAREAGADERNKRHEHGCVLSALPTEWGSNEERTTRWSIMTVPAQALESRVVSTLTRLRR